MENDSIQLCQAYSICTHSHCNTIVTTARSTHTQTRRIIHPKIWRPPNRTFTQPHNGTQGQRVFVLPAFAWERLARLRTFFFFSPSAQIAQGYGDQDPGPHAARTQRSAEPGGGHYLFLALSLSVSVPFILFPGWVLAGQAPTKENMENNLVLIYVRISLLTWWIGSMRLKPMRKLFRETNPVEPKQWLSRAEVNRKLCVGEIIGRNKIMKGICQSIGVYFAFKSWIDIAFWLTYLQTVKSGISIVYLRFSWIYFDMTDQSWC